jgi:hypothetical protein
MADWIDCELTIFGDKDNLDTFERNAKGSIQKYLGDEHLDVGESKENLCFHKLYPVPSKFTQTYYDEKSYEWERKHWGCKWGAKHSKIKEKTDEILVYQFLVTHLPIKWLVKVSLDYQDLVFHLEAEDELTFKKVNISVESGIVLEF